MTICQHTNGGGEMSWRDRARPIIAAVLAEMEGKSLKEKRAALREAFPFGPRQYHPYKIWLSECAYQLGLKKPKTRQKNAPLPFVPMPGQQSFLE
jgi:hypothetical protein